MADCTHDCSSCGSSCSERTAEQNLRAKLNGFSSVGKVYAVVSGKGGVGKSLVTSLMAAAVAKTGRSTAILDADITGPSIPQIFGVHEKAQGSEAGILPAESKGGVKLMSINLLTEKETDPVLWRGPVIAGVVTQFWTDVAWGHVDYMFVDMPPGTGDVPLTVFQSLPVDGIIVVTSPQDLVSMIVAKAVNMAKLMNIPIVGIIENYSFVKCPDCGREIYVFGESKVEKAASEHGIKVLARLPVDPAIAAACDAGTLESYENQYVDEAVREILK